MKKNRSVKIGIIIIVIITLLFIWYRAYNITTGQQVPGQRGQVRVITPEEAKKRLEQNEDILLLDVRSREEYLNRHIPGSKLIPLPIIEAEEEVVKKIPDKNRIIFVYCRSGHRSAIAAATLIELGYKNVFDLGGIIDWPYATKSGE